MSRAENCTAIEAGNKSGKQSCNGSVQVFDFETFVSTWAV